MADDKTTEKHVMAGDRVVLSGLGREQFRKPARQGTVLRVRFDGKVIVQWDGNKSKKSDTPWHPDLLSVVEPVPKDRKQGG